MPILQVSMLGHFGIVDQAHCVINFGLSASGIHPVSTGHMPYLLRAFMWSENPFMAMKLIPSTSSTIFGLTPKMPVGLLETGVPPHPLPMQLYCYHFPLADCDLNVLRRTVYHGIRYFQTKTYYMILLGRHIMMHISLKEMNLPWNPQFIPFNGPYPNKPHINPNEIPLKSPISWFQITTHQVSAAVPKLKNFLARRHRPRCDLRRVRGAPGHTRPVDWCDSSTARRSDGSKGGKGSESLYLCLCPLI